MELTIMPLLIPLPGAFGIYLKEKTEELLFIAFTVVNLVSQTIIIIIIAVNKDMILFILFTLSIWITRPYPFHTLYRREVQCPLLNVKL